MKTYNSKQKPEIKAESSGLLQAWLHKLIDAKLKNKPILVSVEPGVPIWAQGALVKGLMEFFQASGMRHSYNIIHRGAWREKSWKIRDKLLPFGSVDYIIGEAKKGSMQAGIVNSEKMLNLIAIEPDWSDIPRYEVWLIKSPMNGYKVDKKLLPSVSGSEMTVIISTNWYPNYTSKISQFSQKEKKVITKLCLWIELKKILKLELHGQHRVDDCEVNRILNRIKIVHSVPSGVNIKTALCKHCLKKLKELE